MIAHAVVDPRALTAEERKGLELAHDHRLLANASGYYGRAPHRVTRAMAFRLIEKGLMRLDTKGLSTQLMLTGNGLYTYGVMVERRQRRSA